MSDFSLNQIVDGAAAGTFVIIGFTLIGAERAAMLKCYNPETNRVGRGQLALPLDRIVARADGRQFADRSIARGSK